MTADPITDALIPSDETPADRSSSKASKTTPTSYVVLESSDGGETWRQIGVTQGSSRSSAVARTVNAAYDGTVPRSTVPDSPFLWQAVPVRSWKALKENVPESPPPPPSFVEAQPS